MQRPWTLIVAAAISAAISALMAASCDHLRTASGDYGVTFDDFIRIDAPPPYLVLEGTRLCTKELRCGPCDEDPPVCEDVTLAVDGGGMSDCRTVEIGMPLTYTFTPQGCTSSHPAEALLVDAVAASEVSARFDPHTTGADQRDQLGFPASTQGAPLPTPDVYVPVQILTSTSAELRVDLIEQTSGRVVGWNPSAGKLEIQAQEGPAPAVKGGPHDMTLTATEPGSRASAVLNLNSLAFPLADVVAVGPEAIERLEITAVFYDEGATGMLPIQIEAHAIDPAGKHILGLPIEWRVLAGDLVLDLGEDKQPSDIAALLECLPEHPKTTRSGVIEAVYGEHQAELEVTWTAYKGDEHPYNAGPCEEQGCGCRGGTSGGEAALGLGLFALVLRRRRRPIASV